MAIQPAAAVPSETAAYFPLASGAFPDRPAILMSDGTRAMTYAQLDALSDALARQLSALGTRAGGRVAILMENRPELFVAAWAGQRSGLHYVPVNWHLHPDEVIAILEDCAATVLLVSPARLDLARAAMARLPGLQLLVCEAGTRSGFTRDDDLAAEADYTPLEGSTLFYSGGTSSRPKGIARALSGLPYGWLEPDDIQLPPSGQKFTPDTVFLCTTPLYHAAGLGPSLILQRMGGTVVACEKFEAEATLAAIDRFSVTHCWMVPTMFVRLLRLPEAVRDRYSLSSLERIIHAAGPCPRAVKQAMFDWVGPRIHEYYSGTEGVGATYIGPEEWLAHPGSVGRSDKVRIVGADGQLLPPGETGTIYFVGTRRFEYLNESELTAAAYDRNGWSTLGDVGHVDADGWLYLTDRLTNKIIIGGVNIYPQEIEDALIAHPAVMDVAVVGVPNAEYGEEIKAVVVPEPGHRAGPALEQAISAFARERLARFKCPRSFDFVEELPRLPSGKLLKRELRKRYWPDDAAR